LGNDLPVTPRHKRREKHRLHAINNAGSINSAHKVYGELKLLNEENTGTAIWTFMKDYKFMGILQPSRKNTS